MPESLRNHLHDRLRTSLRHSGHSSVTASQLDHVLSHIEQRCFEQGKIECAACNRLLRKCVHTHAISLSKRCARVTETATAVLNGDIDNAIDAALFEDHSKRRQIIGGLHQQLRHQVERSSDALVAWRSTASAGEANANLRAYAEQACFTGSHDWCKQLNTFLMQYAASYASNSADEAAVNKRVPSILDVGSSYDACKPLRGASTARVTAIDLVPMDPCVYACDFLYVCLVGDEEKKDDGVQISVTARSDTYVADDNAEWAYDINSIRTASFDAVLLSLVISFVPDSCLRARLVGNARAVLRRGGLLLIGDTMSINRENKAQSTKTLSQWRHAIEAAGMRLERSARLRGTHALIFRALDDGSTAHCNSVGPLPIAADYAQSSSSDEFNAS